MKRIAGFCLVLALVIAANELLSRFEHSDTPDSGHFPVEKYVPSFNAVPSDDFSSGESASEPQKEYGEYESGISSDTGGDVMIESISVTDAVYCSLGNSYRNIYDAYDQSRYGSTMLSLRDFSYNGYYRTCFANERSVNQIFYSEGRSGDQYFQDQDYCFGVMGWFDRLFSVQRSKNGLFSVKELARALNATNTYLMNQSDDPDAPENLNGDWLYMIEAELSTAVGTLPCVVAVEAPLGEDSDVGSGDWVKISVSGWSTAG